MNMPMINCTGGVSGTLRPLHLALLVGLALMLAIASSPASAQTSGTIETVGGASFQEGATSSISVKLSAAPTSIVTISAVSSDTSAATVTPGSITFWDASNWETTKNFVVTAVQDDDTNNENVTVTLSITSGGFTAPNKVLGFSITDDDAPPSGTIVTEPSSGGALDENAGTGVIGVKLSAAPTSTVTISAVSSDTSALTIAPSSYTYTTTNWNDTRNFTREVLHDSDKDDETVRITFSVESGGFTAPDKVMTFSITDDEAVYGVTLTDDDGNALTSLDINEDGSTTGKTFKVKLAEQPTGNRDVVLRSTNAGLVVDTDTDTAGPQNSLEFTPSNWNTAQTVRITAATDTTLDDETATINLTGSRVTSNSLTVNLWEVIRADRHTNNNFGMNEGETASIKYNLEKQQNPENRTATLRDRTITISSSDDTALKVSLDGSTFTNSITLTFTQDDYNMGTQKTFTISAEEDSDSDDEANKTINYEFSNGVIRNDNNWRSRVDVRDDEFNLTVPSADVDVIEGETATFDVTLASQPGNSGDRNGNLNRTVKLTSDNDDVTLNPDSLTFTHGNYSTAQTVTITAADDSDTTDETVTITLSGGGFVDATVDVALADDDDPVGLTLSKSTLTVDEDNTDTFTVKLASAPVGNRTVNVVSDDTSAVTVSPATLDFTSANYDTAQPVTVTTVDDSDSDSESVTINLTGATGDAITASSATVNVNDDDISLVLTDTPLTIDEGSSGTFKVKLSKQPSGNVAVALTAAGDLTLNKSSLTFTTTNWEDDQTVTVTAGQDDDLADDTGDSISLSASGGGYAGVTATAEVTVDDDDTAALTLSDVPLTIDEEGSGTFRVRLTYQPSATVTVTLAQPANTDVTLDTDTSASNNQNTLMFTTSNWNVDQTVTVSAADDSNKDNEEVTISISAADGGYAGITTTARVNVTDNDLGLALSVSSLMINEGATGGTFEVELKGEPTANVMVTLSLSAALNNKVSISPLGPLTFTTGNWDDPQPITVTATDDPDGANVSGDINLTASGATEYVGLKGAVMIEVDDDEDPMLTLTPTSLTFAEGATSGNTFTVALAVPPTDEVEVALTQSGTTNPDVEFSPTPLTFTTATWNTAQTVTVTAARDADSADDSATISLSASGSDAAEYAGIASSSLVVTVTDDGNIGMVLSETSLNINEGATGTFTVELGADPGASRTVSVVSGDTSAVTVSPASLTFMSSGNNPWNTPQTVTVTATSDADIADDSATITLSGTGLTASSLAVTVADDDVNLVLSTMSLTITEEDADGADFTVALSKRPLADITVALAAADSDVELSKTSLTFTTANWETAQTVKVTAIDDADSEDDSTTINLTGANITNEEITVMVTDDDVGLELPSDPLTIQEGGSGTFNVSLKTLPTGDVTVTPSAPANSGLTFAPATLTFTAGNGTTAQTFTVTAAEDDDGADDSVTVTLSAEDGGYDGQTGSVMVTVTDNDRTLMLSASKQTVEEGRDHNFSVWLKTRPSANVTVTLAQSGTPNADVTFDTDSVTAGKQNTLTFTTANWETPQTVRVYGAEDDDGANDMATIELTAAGGGYDNVTDTVTITVDDDEEPMLTLSAASLTIIEEGSSDNTFTVQLSVIPTEDVTVTLAQSGTPNSDVEFTPTSLTFMAGDYSTPQTVTVTAGPDDDIANDMATITLTAAGGGYDNVTANVTVNVTDNDVPQLVLTGGSALTGNTLTLDEGTTQTFMAKLSQMPSASVTVALASSNGDVTLDPAMLTFTTANYNANQSVTVTAMQDPDTADDTATVTLTGTGARIGAGSMTVNVTDDGKIGLILAPATSLPVNEGGEATFTVGLHSAPSADQTVTLTPSAGITVDTDPSTTGNQNTLTFTAADGTRAKTVTVMALDDADREDNIARINLASTDANTQVSSASLTVSITDDDKGATLEQEEEAAAVILAEVVGALLPAASDAIGVRFDAPRAGRFATVAGRQIALDRSLAQDLAAGFASRAGVQDTSQGRFAEDSFGAERQSGEWLGGIPLDAGRPLRSAGERSSGLSGASTLLSDFSYALNATGSGGSGWSIWGRFDTGEFSGTNDDVEFDSSQSSIWFGADRRLDNGLLSGVAYSSSGTDADYTLGKYGAALETDLTLVLPYAETEFDNGARGHAMLGIGSGEATITQTDRQQGSADLSVYMLAAGASWPTAWELGAGSLSWSGDFGYTSLSTSGGALASLNGLSVSSMQIKGGMELAFDEMGGALRAAPRAALLMRLDTGDGVTGTGFELTGGMLMTSSSSDRFSVDVNLRTLIMHSAEDLTDWGLSIQARFNTRGDGSGLGLALGPHWGAPDDGLLERDEAFRLDEAGRQSRQLNQRDRGLAGSLGYGLRAFGGMLTPYTEYRFTSGNAGSIRQVAGVRFSDSEALELSLFSERHIARLGEARSRLAVELQKRF